MAKKVRDRGVKGRSHGNLGNSYDSLGDYSKAIKYFTHHLAIAHEVDNRAEERVAYSNLGCVSNSLMDFFQAIKVPHSGPGDCKGGWRSSGGGQGVRGRVSVAGELLQGSRVPRAVPCYRAGGGRPGGGGDRKSVV